MPQSKSFDTWSSKEIPEMLPANNGTSIVAEAELPARDDSLVLSAV